MTPDRWTMPSSDTSATQPTTLDADWLITMDGPAIRKGRVVFTDRILAVGPAAQVPAIGRHVRLGPCVLMPGLINAHCHLELSAHHGALPAGDFWNWLPALVAKRLEQASPLAEQQAVAPAVASMLESGTTCVGDICRADWVVQTLQALPIRKVCYIELISGGFSPPADIPQLQNCLDALPYGGALLTPGLSPHTPYTVTRDDLEACGRLAHKRGLPLAIHLAETRDEIEWLRYGTGRIADWHARLFAHPPRSPAIGPTEYALACLGTTPAALIHMNHADDWQRLCERPADAQPAAVYCPRSHRFFGHADHPWRDMLAAGLKVAVGTDSAASHQADEARPLSVLDELRWLGRECPDVPARTLLEMATLHAAAAVGLSTRIGRLAPGYEADLVAFALPRPGVPEPALAILDSEQLPSRVYVAGRCVVGTLG